MVTRMSIEPHEHMELEQLLSESLA
ncbi:MAG: hypothetical protein QOJ23_3573, partial [Actinomycetota bacterium]|nr:hypothetical protein [Actinomycetota bacterium]